MTEDEEIDAIAILQVGADQINVGSVAGIMLIVVDDMGRVATLSTQNSAVFNSIDALIADVTPQQDSFTVAGTGTVQ